MTEAQVKLLLTVARILRNLVFWDGATNKYEAIKELDRGIKAVEVEKSNERTRGREASTKPII